MARSKFKLLTLVLWDNHTYIALWLHPGPWPYVAPVHTAHSKGNIPKLNHSVKIYDLSVFDMPYFIPHYKNGTQITTKTC